MRHQSTSVKIDSCNICRVGNDTCANNGKYICYQCQIFSGNSDVPIKFTPAPKVPTADTLDQKKIVIKLPQQEVKDTLPNPDNEEAHFVHHSAVAIHHFHTYNMRTHIHYLIDDRWLGSRCHICGIPVIGKNFCESCNSIFESASENSNNVNSLAG